MKKALITGIFGQDGSYLAEILTEQGYQVHGIARTHLSDHAQKISAHLKTKGIKPIIHECDLLNQEQIGTLVKMLQPEECYHLAATHYSSQAHRGQNVNAMTKIYTDNVLSVLHLLNVFTEISPNTRLILAGSCAMFSATHETPHNETTHFATDSLYGLSKVSIAELADHFRKMWGLHVSVAILYNHESPRRPEDFVTKKIVHNLKRMSCGEINGFELDNLYSVKDWGYAKDYANGIHLMGLQTQPQNFILATGIGHSIETFLSSAAELIGVSNWREKIQVRQAEMPNPKPIPLIGDPAKAVEKLGWHHTLSFNALVALLVKSEFDGVLD